jgi:hypothetical protein
MKVMRFAPRDFYAAIILAVYGAVLIFIGRL